jgi:hypothetical protein
VVVLGYFGAELVYGSDSKPQTSQAPVNPPTVAAEGFKKVERSGFSFEWRVRGDLLDVRYGFATTGWVGIGFGKTGTMEGSSIVIGYVKDGKVVLEDHFGDAEDEHESRLKLGEQSYLTNVAGTVSNGVTSLSFTRPLKASGKNDVTLVPGDTISVIMAHADAGTTDLQAYHGPSSRISFTVQL